MTAACIEEENVKSFHWRIIFTAGMGFFTDAYDLFIIGVVTSLLRPLWHLTTWQLATLNGASLAAAAFGAVIFGMLSDKLGRKKMYGIEVAILLVFINSPLYCWLWDWWRLSFECSHCE
jgi:PHS family inorganic phosphate transporter-like MFS transporter